MKNEIKASLKAITFAEFVEYGKTQTTNIYNEMPWSFEYEGHPVSHETDSCYIISDGRAGFHFTPDQTLITWDNEIFALSNDVIKAIADGAATVKAEGCRCGDVAGDGMIIAALDRAVDDLSTFICNNDVPDEDRWEDQWVRDAILAMNAATFRLMAGKCSK
jgi:hypothetical protein